MANPILMVLAAAPALVFDNLATTAVTRRTALSTGLAAVVVASRSTAAEANQYGGKATKAEYIASLASGYVPPKPREQIQAEVQNAIFDKNFAGAITEDAVIVDGFAPGKPVVRIGMRPTAMSKVTLTKLTKESNDIAHVNYSFETSAGLSSGTCRVVNTIPNSAEGWKVCSSQNLPL